MSPFSVYPEFVYLDCHNQLSRGLGGQGGRARVCQCAAAAEPPGRTARSARGQQHRGAFRAGRPSAGAWPPLSAPPARPPAFFLPSPPLPAGGGIRRSRRRSLAWRAVGGAPGPPGRPREARGGAAARPAPFGPAPPARAPPIGPPACPSAPGPTPQARLSCAYVGLDSRGLEELPLEPERRKEAKYQQRRGVSGARPRSPLPAARLPAPAPTAGAQAPRRRPGPARTPASFVIPPRPELRLPGVEDPPDRGRGPPLPAVTPPSPSGAGE